MAAERWRHAALRVCCCLGLLLGAARTAAQEDESGEASRKRHRGNGSLETEYSLGVFGGAYLEEPRAGVLVDAALSVALRRRAERFRLGLGYSYDPFTTKTFNFPEEDQGARRARLVQAMQELNAFASWRSRWSSALKSELGLSGSVWIPELDRDRRWSLGASARARLGKLRGYYAELSLDAALKKYPNYFIADRRIDQREVGGALELGHRFERNTGIGAGLELEWTDYLDARYDRLTATGVVRADESKDYFTRGFFVRFDVAPARALEIAVSYRYELNDSSHYDRQISGCADPDCAQPERKLIPDYYDYRRHRVALKPTLELGRKFRASLSSELWTRDFDTYEARSEDNVWTGELRQDTSFEAGFEAAYRVLAFRRLGVKHGLFVSGFGSYLHRLSNMRREESFATNFDVTRVFLGLEARAL